MLAEHSVISNTNNAWTRHWPSIAGMSPQSHCGDEDGHIGLSSWNQHINIMLLALCLLSTLLVLTLTMPELRHWPSIAGTSQQSHCGDKRDGRIGLSSWHHYISVTILGLCLLSTHVLVVVVVWALLSFKVFISSELRWLALNEWNSCFLQIDLNCLKKKQCFVLDVSRFCFCKMHRFQNLCHHHKHYTYAYFFRILGTIKMKFG